MKDDFGYFGSGLEGYVQYNEAFKRNFDASAVPNRDVAELIDNEFTDGVLDECDYEDEDENFDDEADEL